MKPLILATVKNHNNLIAYLALGAVCIIWGTTYLALRVGVTQFPPFLFSGIRFLIAGPILLGILIGMGRVAFPSKKIIAQQAVSGLLLCTFGVGIVGWSEMYVSSGLAAIICSVMPHLGHSNKYRLYSRPATHTSSRHRLVNRVGWNHHYFW